jgi:HPr kinase/phosphorylase
MDSPDDILHATGVVVEGKGVLLIGPSGSGKSRLALELIGLGAQLICDDRVRLSSQDGRLYAHAVDTIAGMIEARGFGVLNCPHIARHSVEAVIDLQPQESARFPKDEFITLRGLIFPKFNFKGKFTPAAAIHLWARYGRAEV